jgi:hypothetical protein
MAGIVADRTQIDAAVGLVRASGMSQPVREREFEFVGAIGEFRAARAVTSPCGPKMPLLASWIAGCDRQRLRPFNGITNGVSSARVGSAMSAISGPRRNAVFV